MLLGWKILVVQKFSKAVHADNLGQYRTLLHSIYRWKYRLDPDSHKLLNCPESQDEIEHYQEDIVIMVDCKTSNSDAAADFSDKKSSECFRQRALYKIEKLVYRGLAASAFLAWRHVVEIHLLNIGRNYKYDLTHFVRCAKQNLQKFFHSWNITASSRTYAYLVKKLIKHIHFLSVVDSRTTSTNRSVMQLDQVASFNPMSKNMESTLLQVSGCLKDIVEEIAIRVAWTGFSRHARKSKYLRLALDRMSIHIQSRRLYIAMTVWIHHISNLQNLFKRVIPVYLRSRFSLLMRVFRGWRILTKVRLAIFVCFNLICGKVDHICLKSSFHAWRGGTVGENMRNYQGLFGVLLDKKANMYQKSLLFCRWKDQKWRKMQNLSVLVCKAMKHNFCRLVKIFYTWLQFVVNNSSMISELCLTTSGKFIRVAYSIWLSKMCRSKLRAIKTVKVISIFYRRIFRSWNFLLKQTKCARQDITEMNKNRQRRNLVVVSFLKMSEYQSYSRCTRKTEKIITQRYTWKINQMYMLCWSHYTARNRTRRLIQQRKEIKYSYDRISKAIYVWKLGGSCSISLNVLVNMKISKSRSVAGLHTLWRWYGYVKKTLLDDTLFKLDKVELELFKLQQIFSDHNQNQKNLSEGTTRNWDNDEHFRSRYVELPALFDSFPHEDTGTAKDDAGIGNASGKKFLLGNPSVTRQKQSLKPEIQNSPTLDFPFPRNVRSGLADVCREQNTSINPEGKHTQLASSRSSAQGQDVYVELDAAEFCEFSAAEKDRMELEAEIFKLQMTIENMTPKHLYDDLQEEMIQLSLENQHLRNVQEKVVETMVDKHIADRLHNENEHYLNELLKLKSSLDNMVPKSQLKMLEFEATWLFQEIERLQNVVDSAMIRNMPEALQLERCFVSAEVCSSFFVRALVRLGRLLDKNPNHSKQLEFASFDTSVYD